MQTSRKSAKPVDRLVTITLDPAHWGRIPVRLDGGYLRKGEVTLEVARRLKEGSSTANPACGPF